MDYMPYAYRLTKTVPVVTRRKQTIAEKQQQRREAGLVSDQSRGISVEQAIINAGRRSEFYNTSDEELRQAGLIR